MLVKEMTDTLISFVSGYALTNYPDFGQREMSWIFDIRTFQVGTYVDDNFPNGRHLKYRSEALPSQPKYLTLENFMKNLNL